MKSNTAMIRAVTQPGKSKGYVLRCPDIVGNRPRRCVGAASRPLAMLAMSGQDIHLIGLRRSLVSF